MSEINKICEKHSDTVKTRRKCGRYKCPKCNTEAVTKRRKLLKVMAIEYKGGKCIRCGYSKCHASLAFHHLDPAHKDFAIGHKGYTRSWESVKRELDKCVLVCNNCHGEIHEELQIGQFA